MKALQIAFVVFVMLAWATLVIAMIGCGPTSYGATFADHADDPKTLAMATYLDLDEWDHLVGVREPVPIRLQGEGLMPMANGNVELGECLRVAGWREITVNLDAVRAFPADARAVFRHALFHELVHAHLTCSDADHSPDPTNLMHALTSLKNVNADPDAATIAAIRGFP